jgi:hypothetical protein
LATMQAVIRNTFVARERDLASPPADSAASDPQPQELPHLAEHQGKHQDGVDEQQQQPPEARTYQVHQPRLRSSHFMRATELRLVESRDAIEHPPIVYRARPLSC